VIYTRFFSLYALAVILTSLHAIEAMQEKCLEKPIKQAQRKKGILQHRYAKSLRIYHSETENEIFYHIYGRHTQKGNSDFINLSKRKGSSEQLYVYLGILIRDKSIFHTDIFALNPPELPSVIDQGRVANLWHECEQLCGDQDSYIASKKNP